MALGATIYNVDVELSDTDRQVYESVALRVARHPSESEEYLSMLVIPICTLDRNWWALTHVSRRAARRSF